MPYPGELAFTTMRSPQLPPKRGALDTCDDISFNARKMANKSAKSCPDTNSYTKVIQIHAIKVNLSGIFSRTKPGLVP